MIELLIDQISAALSASTALVNELLINKLYTQKAT